MGKEYSGQEWATHLVSLLLSNTHSLYFTGRELSQDDPTGAKLGQWVGEWFWGDLASLGSTDKGAVQGTRDDISRNDFEGIDWKSIAEDLAAE